MKIAIVTDSTAYLSHDEVAALDIKVMPIPVIIDGTVYREGIDLTTDEFYPQVSHQHHNQRLVNGLRYLSRCKRMVMTVQSLLT